MRVMSVLASAPTCRACRTCVIPSRAQDRAAPPQSPPGLRVESKGAAGRRVLQGEHERRPSERERQAVCSVLQARRERGSMLRSGAARSAGVVVVAFGLRGPRNTRPTEPDARRGLSSSWHSCGARSVWRAESPT
eukprot:5354212-Prymnesium_polylepis.1